MLLSVQKRQIDLHLIRFKTVYFFVTIGDLGHQTRVDFDDL
jgi:hypothetical protein